MITVAGNTNPIQNTTHKVVLPFYVFASVSFFISVVLLFFSTDAFTTHHFHPHTLAITHSMALGWGTMIILGASHQLVPVLIESRLESNVLASLSFYFAASGIPMLVWSFYQFNFGIMAQTGALLINAAIIVYLINISASIVRSRKTNVHAIYVLTAGIWLLTTTVIGFLLLLNFKYNFLAKDSLHYLSLHAHIGIIGWFLLLVIGVGSRLIPMFMISKYDNVKLLWVVFLFMNAGIIFFIFIFFMAVSVAWYLLPVFTILAALFLFGRFCVLAYKKRIRKQIDAPMKISLLSVLMMALPVLLILIMICLLVLSGNSSRLVLTYGFSVFFGWLTAIILGMTFKTLPFIIWNKIYHDKAGLGRTPNPKNLFSEKVFNVMGFFYLPGFLFFVAGVLISNLIILQTGAIFLLITAFFYNLNVFKMLVHKPDSNG